MIKLLLISSIFLAFAAKTTNIQSKITALLITDTSIYNFKVDGLDGDIIDLSIYKGKKIMIVNTASYCGNTHQYAELETLSKI